MLKKIFFCSLLLWCLQLIGRGQKIQDKKFTLPTQQDSLYVTIDSSGKYHDNTNVYVFVFNYQNHRYQIYREKSMDYSIEVDSITYQFKLDSVHWEGLDILDLPTGRNKTILRDKKSNIFFVTEWYNNHSGNDTLILSSLNLLTLSVIAKSSDPYYSDYKLHVKKLWEPTKSYMRKTKF